MIDRDETRETVFGIAVILLGIVVIFGGFVLLWMVGNEMAHKGRVEAFAVCSELAMDPEKCRKLVEGQ